MIQNRALINKLLTMLEQLTKTIKDNKEDMKYHLLQYKRILLLDKNLREEMNAIGEAVRILKDIPVLISENNSENRSNEVIIFDEEPDKK